MFLPSDQKSNNPFLPGSSIVTGHYPSDPNRSAGAAPDIMQQQMYAPPPGPPNQRNYHSEVPPPAYDSVPSAGISIHFIILSLGTSSSYSIF
jgi:hypothetical protein